MALDATVIGRVAIKVVPDTRGFRSKAQTLLDSEAKGLSVDVGFEALVQEAIEEVNTAVKTAEKQARAVKLKLDLNDQAEINAGIRQIEKELDKLKDRTEINVDLNRDDLIAARELLQEELDAVATIDLRVDYNDRTSIARALSQIEDRIAEFQKVDLSVSLDEDSLRDEAQALRATLEAMTRNIDFSYDPDSLTSVQKQIGVIDTELDRLREVTLTVDMDEQSLREARASLNNIADVHVRAQIDRDNEAFARLRNDVELALFGVEVSPHLDDRQALRLRQDVEQAFAQIDELELSILPDLADRELFEIQAKIDTLRSDIDVNLNQLSAFGVEAQLAALSRDRDVDITTKLRGETGDKLLRAVTAFSGVRVTTGIVKEFGAFIQSIDKISLALGAVSLGVVGLSSAALAGSSSLIALGGSLASIVPAAIALPGILGGAVVGMGAFVAVIKDFPQHFPAVIDAFQDLQNKMAPAFYSKFAEPFEQMVDTLFPAMERGLIGTSSAMGIFFGSLSDRFGTTGFADSLSTMFDGLNESILVSTTYTGAFAGVIEKLGLIGAQNLPALADYVGGLADQFNNFLERKGTDGLQQFVDTGVDALQDLGRAIGATGSIFASLNRAAEAAGAGGLLTFADALETAADVVKGADFQSGLVQAFSAARTTVSNFADEVDGSIGGLTARIVDLFADVAPGVGSSLGKLVAGIADALNRDIVSDRIVNAFDSLDQAIENLVPVLPIVADKLSLVLEIAGELAAAITQVLASALDGIGDKFTGLLEDVIPFISAMADLASAAVDAASVLINLVPNEFILLGAGMAAAYVGAQKLALGLGLVKGQLVGTAIGGAISALTKNIATIGSTMATAGARTQRESQRMKTALGGIAATAGKAALGLGALTVAAGSAGDASTASLAFIGAALGGLAGAGIGAVIGGFKDFKKYADIAADAQRDFNDAIGDMDDVSITGYTTAFEKLDAATDEYFSKYGDGSVFGQLKNSFTPSGFFQNLDVLFGDGVDKMNEATKAALAAEIGLGDLELAGRDLAHQFGIVPEDIAKSAISVEQMDQAFRAAAPALQAMGLGVEDIIAAVKDGSIGELYQDIAAYTASLDSSEGRTSAFGAALRGLDNDAIATSVSADSLKKSLDSLLDPQLDAEAATDQWRTALNGLSKTFAENGLKFGGYSEAALENRDATRGYTEDVKAMLVAEAGVGASKERIAALLAQSRSLLIEEGAAANGSTVAIEARANAIGLTPELITTVFNEVGLDIGKRKAKALLGQLEALPKSVVSAISLNGIPNSVGAAKRLANELDITGKPRKILLSLAGDKEVKDKVTGVRREVDEFGDIVVKPILDAEDKASKTVKEVSDKATKLGKQVAKVKVELIDNASAGINAVALKLSNLNGRTAVVTTRHQSIYSSKRVGGGGSGDTGTLGRSIIGFPSQKSLTDYMDRLRRQFRKNFSSALVQMQNRANNAFDSLLRKFDSKAEKTKLKSMFGNDLGALADLEKLHEKLMKQYDKATAKLAAYRREMAAFKEQVSSTVIATGDVTQLGAFTYDGITRGLGNAVDRAKEFRTVIRELIDADINDTTLQQLLAAGPETGLAAAKAILSGGVQGINDLQSELEAAANGVASNAGDAIYGDLIKDAKKDVNQLLQQLVPLQKKIANFVKKLMKALKAQLKSNAVKVGLGDVVDISDLFDTKKNKKNLPTPGGRPALKSIGSGTGSTTGTTQVVQKTLNYYAAPNNSLDSEDDLFAAVGRAQGGWL